MAKGRYVLIEQSPHFGNIYKEQCPNRAVKIQLLGAYLGISKSTTGHNLSMIEKILKHCSKA